MTGMCSLRRKSSKNSKLYRSRIFLLQKTKRRTPMPNRIITDISDYIFVSGEPQKVDAIFLPGGSYPEQPEYAAELYRQGLTDWIVPSGGVSVKEEKWHGVRSKAEIYSGDYRSDCEFFTDVLVKTAFRRLRSLKKASRGIPVITHFFLVKPLMKRA